MPDEDQVVDPNATPAEEGDDAAEAGTEKTEETAPAETPAASAEEGAAEEPTPTPPAAE